MIRQICWYLTRRCNLKCEYCNVWKEKRKELNTKESLRLLDKVKEINPELLVFFGGEPTLRKDFSKLVEKANDLDINYAIITNGTQPIDLSICKNITCSIDIDNLKNLKSKDINLKSHKGYELLLKAKIAGVPDICGNIIIHKQSYQYVPDLIKHLSALKIWSIVGYVHSGTKAWDFRSNCTGLLMNKDEIKWISNELLELKRNPNILLHNVEEFFTYLPKYYDYSWNCSKMEYLTVDSDGTIMACPDRRGERCPTHNIFNLNLKKLETDWKEDVKDCPGCFYNHQIQLAYSKPEQKVLLHE